MFTLQNAPDIAYEHSTYLHEVIVSVKETVQHQDTFSCASRFNGFSFFHNVTDMFQWGRKRLIKNSRCEFESSATLTVFGRKLQLKHSVKDLQNMLS